MRERVFGARAHCTRQHHTTHIHTHTRHVSARTHLRARGTADADAAMGCGSSAAAINTRQKSRKRGCGAEIQFTPVGLQDDSFSRGTRGRRKGARGGGADREESENSSQMQRRRKRRSRKRKKCSSERSCGHAVQGESEAPERTERSLSSKMSACGASVRSVARRDSGKTDSAAAGTPEQTGVTIQRAHSGGGLRVCPPRQQSDVEIAHPNHQDMQENAKETGAALLKMQSASEALPALSVPVGKDAAEQQQQQQQPAKRALRFAGVPDDHQPSKKLGELGVGRGGLFLSSRRRTPPELLKGNGGMCAKEQQKIRDEAVRLRRYACSVCDRALPTAGELKDHMRTAHDDSGSEANDT
eukprot:TRINITY_DN12062_c2_g1_i1.p1 TRINITY_DN12062_c2_g1~~TRINITY_DN12062_c2_g1_i1.p1  ORF type:complete len:357 (+),score=36.32 TRINITY_DN12062_c2_g1_i1:166-1236(+)